jgi:hypothetical protein
MTSTCAVNAAGDPAGLAEVGTGGAAAGPAGPGVYPRRREVCGLVACAGRTVRKIYDELMGGLLPGPGPG